MRNAMHDQKTSFAFRVKLVAALAVIWLFAMPFVGLAASASYDNATPIHSEGAFFGTRNTNDSEGPSGSIAPMASTPPPGGGGGGGSAPVTVTFYIFDGKGEISLNGNLYANDTTATLTSGGSYGISSANLASGYSFYEWLPNCGSVSNDLSSSTTYTPSASGTLTMVVFSVGQSSNWAGYEESGPSTSSQGLTQASAIINVPSSISYVGGVSGTQTSQEMVGFWVGLGGDQAIGESNSNLWQAGVAIQMNSSGSLWIYTFWEFASGVSTIASSPPEPIFNIYPGDVIYVDISVSGLNSPTEYGNYVIKDETQGFYSSGSVVLPTGAFYGTPLSAEWIAEDPHDNLYVIPDFGSVSFQSVESGSASDMNTPFVYLFSPVANERVKVIFENEGFDQFLTPGTTNSIDFTVSYGQWQS